MDYEKASLSLKALADPSRLKIVDILACGTQCACDILGYFDFTQLALSHHMKVLERAGIVKTEKKGTWNYYTLDEDFVSQFKGLCSELFSNDPSSCACLTPSSCACNV